ncbi:hypothetical protein VPH35_065341 [Triticum aestivum]
MPNYYRGVGSFCTVHLAHREYYPIQPISPSSSTLPTETSACRSSAAVVARLPPRMPQSIPIPISTPPGNPRSSSPDPLLFPIAPPPHLLEIERKSSRGDCAAVVVAVATGHRSPSADAQKKRVVILFFHAERHQLGRPRAVASVDPLRGQPSLSVVDALDPASPSGRRRTPPTRRRHQASPEPANAHLQGP